MPAEPVEMRARQPIPKQELAAIRRSVLEAVRRSSIARSAQSRRENRLRNKRGYTKDQFSADALLDRFVFSPRPALSDTMVMKVIRAAAKRNHQRFFIRFGKVLARKPKPSFKNSIYNFLMTIPPMHVQFLIAHWVDSTDDFDELCRYDSEGLLAVLQHKFGHEAVSMGASGIIKLRQRLGLKPLRRPKVHAILVGKKLKHLD